MASNQKEYNQKQETKKNLFLSLGLIIFALCVTGATYAYFELTSSNNSVTGTAGGASLTLAVNKIAPTNAVTIMTPQLESALGDAISSSHNCLDSDGDVICQVYQATVTNTGKTYTNLKGTIAFDYTTDTTKTVEEKLPNLKWRQITDATTLGDYTTHQATSSETVFDSTKLLAPSASATYYFVIWIDEIGASQTDIGTFHIDINFVAQNGEHTSTIRPNVEYLSQYITNLYNDGNTLTTVNIGGSTDNPEVTVNATQGILLDNNGEYRYYGADPNNYVEFNGELWRIISVSNVKSSEEDTEGSTRVKVIRNESIGTYSWDSSESTINSGSGVNDWTQADLNTELNGLYYNSQSGTCYNGSSNSSTTCDFTSTGLNSESQAMIDDALWYLGGTNSQSSLYSSGWYDIERGTTTYGCSTDDGACPRATTWTGKIGLMYPSDYGYATDLSLCTQTPYNYDTDTNCTSNDWLFNSAYQWTISPNSGRAYRVFLVYSTGNVNFSNAYNAIGVWPVAYLRSDVTISGGEGTSTNPYTLSG